MNNEMNNYQMPISNTEMGFNNVENTYPSQTMSSEIVFQEQAKPYNLRKLKATELFPMLNILKKIGFKKFTTLLQNDDVKNVVTKLKDGESDKIASDDLIGIGSIIFEIAQIILDGTVDCENELFTILSNVSGLTTNEVRQLDLDILVQMIIDLVKENVDFIKAVSKYLK